MGQGRSEEDLVAAVAALTPVPAESVYELRERVSRVNSEDIIFAAMCAAVAGMVILMSIGGVLTLVAETVSARRRDLAIAIALGAPPLAAMRLALKRVANAALWGCAVGLFGYVVAARMYLDRLFSVDALNPALVLTGVAAVVAISTVAAFVAAGPARKVTAASMQELI